MSKITVRADDDLVERLEARDESKSQLVRDALRAYLDGDVGDDTPDEGDRQATVESHASLDDLVAARIDELVEARVDEILDRRLDAAMAGRGQDLNLTIALDGVQATGEVDAEASDQVSDTSPGSPVAGVSDTAGDTHETTCGQCGETVDSDHVYCPNCGEKASHRAFCECGDEVRSDWAFCPSCGRRTPAADVLDST
ncbi:double zinc ribbon domain-containing protein [Haloarchaeobius amylolyticus]|uniref:double zinc ribbon domain-containing protein n=1 Tax=Haloarchaeobius amylolyticus TaxID=1198296 RepID=UPI00226DBB5F|nr:zinc ribbon domain-containing protein [Haloarchaeobius amylolyticus]